MQGITKHPAAAPLTLAMLLTLSVGYFASPAVVQAASEPVIYLDQAWSQADREMYYQTSQGSQIIRYDIFLNLEVAGGQELFRSSENSDRYGLIPQEPNSGTNPDGLAVGLTKTVMPDGRWKGETLGVNCALCHNTQLTYQGKKIRIDGGFNHRLDFMSYMFALDDAMQETLTDASKFDRLAARIEASDPDAKSALRKRFESDAKIVHDYRTVTMVTTVPWGPGRIDAFNLINTRIAAMESGIPENWSSPMAPVKPPFLWNAPQGSWTQWSAVLQDPIARNHGETLGVYLPVDFRSKTPEEGLFESAAILPNLVKLEHLIDRLAPPQWPEEVLGKIDRQKAAEGKPLFMTHCAGCHNAYPYTWTAPNKYGKAFVEVGIVPNTYMGTDASQFTRTQEFALTGHLSPYLEPEYKGKALVPTPIMRENPARASLRTALKALKLSEAQMLDYNGYRELPSPPAPVNSWKAAPREGVWATGPFLHNGSVPNLYEMLIPAAERSKTFYVGRDFDPIKVGVDTSGKSGKFLLDTSLIGNANTGHSFEKGPLGNGIVGPLLTEQERWALVEYLKSIPENAGQVTPFGGSPDSKIGNAPWGKVPTW